MSARIENFDWQNFGWFVEDPDQSWTLPGRCYFDPAIYARELETIFYRSWQYVCHVSRLPQAGHYFVREIGDQSIVLLRDSDLKLRAYHNVCQHRAHRLLEGEGHVGQAITCPYHAWRYDLNGALRFARGSDHVRNFPRSEIQLQSVRVDELCGFLFVNLDPDAEPLKNTCVGLAEEILALAPGAPDLLRAHVQDFPLRANWKNSVENYSECYHCPNRHPSLVDQALDISKYRSAVHAGYHRHISTDVGDRQGYSIQAKGAAGSHEFGSWYLWPNMVFEVYPGGNLTVFHHVPDGPEKTIQQTEWYFANATPTEAEREVIDFVNLVREEDIPICESVQRGLHSKGYKPGRLIVDAERTDVSEHAVHDFQRRVVNALRSGTDYAIENYEP